MTFQDFLDQLSRVATRDDVIRLSPGPLDLKIGEDDALAARILSYLYAHTPDTTTTGEAEGIILYNMLEEMKKVADAYDGPKPLPLVDWLRLGDVHAYLTAWWWLVFWASLAACDADQPRETLLLQARPAAESQVENAAQEANSGIA